MLLYRIKVLDILHVKAEKWIFWNVVALEYTNLSYIW